MSLQIECLVSNFVDVNANVMFDSIRHLSGDISYDSNTGIITIQENGIYEIDWWVATQASVSSMGAVFSLVPSEGGQVIGNSPIKHGEVFGIALLEINEAPVTLELKNVSNATMYYSTNVPVKASLDIVKQDDTNIGVQSPYMATIGRPTQTSILPGEGLLYDSIAQAGVAIVISDQSGYTLFSVTENGVYEFDFSVQIGNVSSGPANFYFDLYSEAGVLLNRISQSVEGLYDNLYFSKVIILQSGEGLYLRFSGLNGNDTQGASLIRAVTIKQLQPL